MNDKRRRLLLFVALAAVVGWSSRLALDEAAVDAEDAAIELAEPARVRADAPRAAAPAAAASAKAEPVTKARLELARADLFPQQTWYVPPPPPPPPPAPPPPRPRRRPRCRSPTWGAGTKRAPSPTTSPAAAPNP